MQKNRRSLFIFRRDLRIQDNTALRYAAGSSDELVCCFIFDPRQIGDHKYKSKFALEFMLNSLEELSAEIDQKGGKLYFFHGEAEQVISNLISNLKIEAVFHNKDYTPFSVKRDRAIESLCVEQSIRYESYDDALLTAPGAVLKDDGTPYTVYTPFYKRASKLEVPEPQRAASINYHTKKIESSVSLDSLQLKNPELDQIFLRGGRSEAKKILNNLSKLEQYKDERDFPAKGYTSGLSAHHKFGTVSIREVYHKAVEIFGQEHQFIKELYWRDFFTHIGHHFPRVFKGNFNRKYDSVKWENDQGKFWTWAKGETGFPIVDAGMRELNQTGYMHNRVRMIVASFLTKDLHINWRWGERYFAQNLIDYDPAVNNGSWQWASSTGCDAQPYFRIFNPWLQQKKFDSEAEYIRKWIPELKNASLAEIHDPERKQALFGYPAPCLDHREAKSKTEALFADALEAA
ncbi:MAG: deoxyribodipyrimidine photo-lyase [Deltaproteobacteria bacterium]|nr:deoxyribodipyrimidine photo-lyase [Deltaproteobacteria bacterium]